MINKRKIKKKTVLLMVICLFITFMLLMLILLPDTMLYYNANPSFLGENAFDGSGYSATIVGDVNGDGYDDILIGAPGCFVGDGCIEHHLEYSGKAYLIFGKASGLNGKRKLSHADASFIGNTTTNEAGISVTGVGDVNGDGLDDFIIGSYLHHGGFELYLFFGKSVGWKKDTNISNADASFSGLYHGVIPYIVKAGDINGDGYDDILIGDPMGEGTAPIDGGDGYLFFGKSTGWAKDIRLADADVRISGAHSDERLGGYITGVGDINKDGNDDFLIGDLTTNYKISPIGTVFLIFGKKSGWPKNFDLSNVNASFIDPAGFHAVNIGGSTGDVNGDGIDDILIDFLETSSSSLGLGRAYLILGKSVGWTKNMSLSNADASFIEGHRDNYCGVSSSISGDINHDDFDDILIGCPGFGTNRVAIFLGKSSGWSQNTEFSKADIQLNGERSEDDFGLAVSSGDVNGDKFDDVLIGAYQNDEGGNTAGKTYLFFGKENFSVIGKERTAIWPLYLVLSILFTLGLALMMKGMDDEKIEKEIHQKQETKGLNPPKP